MRTPRLSGYALASIARLARSGAGGVALKGMMRRDLKVGQLAALPDALRGDFPLDTRPLQARPPRSWEDARHPAPGESAWAGTSDAFTRAYREGATTPREVIERALDAARELAARSPSIGPLLDVAISRRARGRGRVCCALEGGAAEGADGRSPFRREGADRRARAAAKVGSAVLGCVCPARRRNLRRASARARGDSHRDDADDGVGDDAARLQRASDDAAKPALDRLRRGGLVHGVGRGGGDRAGPVRDRGGRRRVDTHPFGALRVFGIKPTWGRVSRHGDTSTGSVSHLGPLASSTLDLARALEAMGPPDAARLSDGRRAVRSPHGSLERGALARREGAADRGRRARVARRRAKRLEGVRGGAFRRWSARGRRSSTFRSRSPGSHRR